LEVQGEGGEHRESHHGFKRDGDGSEKTTDAVGRTMLRWCLAAALWRSETERERVGVGKEGGAGSRCPIKRPEVRGTLPRRAEVGAGVGRRLLGRERESGGWRRRRHVGPVRQRH
jgi:hypothetical protein